MGPDQLRELKRLQEEYERLPNGVSDLTLDKLILMVAAQPNFWALPASKVDAVIAGLLRC